MGDADEGLVDVGVGEPLDLSFGVVGLLEHLVEGLDVVVEEDGGDDCERDVGLHVLVGLVVAVHADVGEQVDVAHEVVELGSVALVEFRQGAGVLAAEDHLDHFVALLVPEVVAVVLGLGDAVLHLELEVPVVELAHEEPREDLLLVLLEDDVVASDEGGEQPEVLGGEVALAGLRGLLEEVVDEFVDGLLGDHGADGDRVVLEDVDEALLDEGLVDVVGLLQEELDPPGEVDLVLQEVLDYLLHQDVGELEDLGDLGADGAVLGELLAAQDLLEGVVQREDQLDDQLRDARLHQDLLHLQNRAVARGLDVLVVRPVDLADEQLEDGYEGDKQVLVEVEEHVLPTHVRVAVLLLELGRDDLHDLHEGLLRGEHVGDIEDGFLRHPDDDEAVLRELLHLLEVDLADVLVEVPHDLVHVVGVGDHFAPLQQVAHAMPLLVLLAHCADQVHQPFALEAAVLDLLLGFDLDVVPLVLEDLASDDVPRPEEVASLGPELVAFLGNQLPKALIADALLSRFLEFLEVVSLVGEGGGDQALVLGVLEVDDIVRLYLVLLLGVLKSAVQDELPQALALVLVDDVDPPVYWLLDGRPVLRVLVSWV